MCTFHPSHSHNYMSKRWKCHTNSNSCPFLICLRHVLPEVCAALLQLYFFRHMSDGLTLSTTTVSITTYSHCLWKLIINLICSFTERLVFQQSQIKLTDSWISFIWDLWQNYISIYQARHLWILSSSASHFWKSHSVDLYSELLDFKYKMHHIKETN